MFWSNSVHTELHNYPQRSSLDRLLCNTDAIYLLPISIYLVMRLSGDHSTGRSLAAPRPCLALRLYNLPLILYVSDAMFQTSCKPENNQALGDALDLRTRNRSRTSRRA